MRAWLTTPPRQFGSTSKAAICKPPSPTRSLLIPATATTLAIEIEPSARATAGEAFGIQPVVLEEDAYGNLETNDYSAMVTATLAGGAGPLAGSDAVTVIGGAAIFADLADNKAETITLAFTSPGLAPAMSAPIVIAPATASRLVVTTQPSTTAMAGAAFLTQPVVMEEDSYGNVETSDHTAVVTASAGSGPGPLAGTTTATLSGGVATFTDLADNKAGTLTLSFTSGLLPAATSASIVISPGTATQWVVTAEPSATATAGVVFPSQPIIDEEDQYGNVETGDSITVVTASLASGPGVLGGASTATVSGGVATFTKLYDDTVGTVVLQFSGGGLAPGMSAQTVVSAGQASQLVLQTQVSATATAGQAFAVQPVVYEEDAFGNLETGDDYTVVTASLSSGAGPLHGTTMVTVSGGIASFAGLADNKAETITLSFRAGGLKPAVSGGTVVSPAAASQLVIQTQPSATVKAGEAFPAQPVIALEDRYGNVETGDSSTVVTASVQNGAGPLHGTSTATVSAGVATFVGLADATAEQVTLAFTSGTLESVTANPVDVAPGAAAKLTVTKEPPASMTAGAGFGLVVTAEDLFGNVEPSFTGKVVVSLANESACADELNGSLTVAAVGGVASFAGLSLDKATAGDTIRVSAAGLTAAITHSIDVMPGPVAQLGVTSQPPAAVGPGAGFGVVVAAEDRFGNVVASQTGLVSVAVASGSGGALSGPATAPLVNGVAMLNGLTLNKAGGYTLEVSGAGLVAAVSNAFTVTPPPTITGEQVLMTGKGKQKHLSGFELFFSSPLAASRAENAANFVVSQKVKHGKKTILKPVSVRVVYSASSDSVSLTLAGKVAFTLGGQIVVNASASSGITDLSGTASMATMRACRETMRS